MATPEQLKTWMGEIREGKNEILFPHSPKQLEITPAEKIRYEANAKFGALLADDLVWLVAHEGDITVEELLSRQKQTSDTLKSDDQRLRFEKITKRLLQLIRVTTAVGKTELLHRIQQYMDIAEEGLGTLRLAQIPSEDIELTSYGAVLVTIRDRHMWEDELEFLPNASGVKQTPWRLEGTTSRQREALGRLIFVKAIDDTQTEKVRSHELFHDLHYNVFQAEMPIRYTTEVQRMMFSRLRNELIAYTIAGDCRRLVAQSYLVA